MSSETHKNDFFIILFLKIDKKHISLQCEIQISHFNSGFFKNKNCVRTQTIDNNQKNKVIIKFIVLKNKKTKKEVVYIKCNKGNKSTNAVVSSLGKLVKK